MLSAEAKPYAFQFVPAKTALVLIDFQRDFIEPGGFGEIQGVHLDAVTKAVGPAAEILKLARAAGLTVVHTREGHEPGLRDCPTCKLKRQANAPNSPHKLVIGDIGSKGSRILVRGEHMHDFIDSLKPNPGEVIIDKPGKGAFYATELHQILVNRAISHLLIVGVTTECCVTSTLKEANDRGFECLLVKDATDGYVGQERKAIVVDMITLSQGLFGYVSDSASVVAALQPHIAEIQTKKPKAWDGSMAIETLRSLYAENVLTPATVVKEVYKRLALPDADPAVWLHVISERTSIRLAQNLLKKYPVPSARPPLFGIPFSIKDSIDIKGLPTTGACPAYAYTAEKDATSFISLVEAGAIPIGKVNLDQLATGVVGMRSPYGQPASVFSKDYISGGSSSGSCVSVASKQVSFSLATDTAGSGRIPAALNNIIGFKPTRGTIPTNGIIPCCLSLDCIAISALTIADTRLVYNVLFSIDPTEAFAKVARPPWALAPRAVLQPGENFRFAIPPAASESRAFMCKEFNVLFEEAVKMLSGSGGSLVEDMDYTIFEDAGRLLYEGSFVAERVSGVREWYDAHPAPAPGSDEKDALLPEIRTIYDAAAKNFTAVDAWSDALKMMQYQRRANAEFAKKDVQVLIVPTVPLHPTKEAYRKDPIGLNHRLGKFTHYGNVLDMTGVSIPAGFTSEGMPFAITVLGQSFTEGMVLEIAQRFERAFGKPVGVDARTHQQNGNVFIPPIGGEKEDERTRTQREKVALIPVDNFYFFGTFFILLSLFILFFMTRSSEWSLVSFLP